MKNDSWSHKWMNNSKTSIMFSNKYVGSNVIYTIDDLLGAMEEKDRAYRLVPRIIIQKVLNEKNRRPLKQCFTHALLA